MLCKARASRLITNASYVETLDEWEQRWSTAQIQFPPPNITWDADEEEKFCDSFEFFRVSTAELMAEHVQTAPTTDRRSTRLVQLRKVSYRQTIHFTHMHLCDSPQEAEKKKFQTSQERDAIFDATSQREATLSNLSSDDEEFVPTQASTQSTQHTQSSEWNVLTVPDSDVGNVASGKKRKTASLKRRRTNQTGESVSVAEENELWAEEQLAKLEKEMVEGDIALEGDVCYCH